MIFSRLFTPAHKSPDATKRKDAIQTLDAHKPEDKSVLHELAFNDADPEVSLAALEKLDSFALWQKMSQIAATDKIKRIAVQRVESALLGEVQTPLNDKERKAFLLESASGELVVRVIQQRPDLLQDHSFITSLVNRMARPGFTQQVLLDARDLKLTEQLLQNTQDTDLLQRLSRKFDDDACLAFVNQRLQSLKAAQEKPAQLEKSLTLILSKLQALTEKSDYELIDEARSHLLSEYNDAWAEHECLTEVLQTSFAQKYQRITAQVDRHLENIRPQWEARQAALTEERRITEAQSQLNAATSSVNRLYEARLCDATLSEVESASHDVRLLEEKVEALMRCTEDTPVLKRLQSAQTALSEKLTLFSAQQQLAQKAVTTLDELTALTQESNNSEEPERVALLGEKWRELSRHLIHVPAEWKARWRESQRVAHSRQTAQKAEAEQRVKQCRKHINAVINLIDKGRFRAAMSRFQKLSELYHDLPEETQAAMSRRFKQVSQDVERLEGWQSYLAAPRRPALIEEARALATVEPANIAERAQTIRYLRKQWQSLTAPGDDPDEQTTFDALLEQAFAPCREHYAQLDREREQATEERIELVASARALDETLPPSNLSQQVEKLHQQWRQAGQVDKETYTRIKSDFDVALSKAQDVITRWHQENRQTKQALVEQALALSDDEDVFAAAQQSQVLQQQWKEVGHAGRRYETKLWKAFKSANDSLFSKLKATKTKQRDESDAALDSLIAQAKGIQQRISADSIHENEQAVNALSASTQSLPKSAKAKAEKALRSVRQTLQKEKEKLAAASDRARYQAVADVITQLIHNQVDSIEEETIRQLDKPFQDALTGSASADKNREWLTTALEVIIGCPSPDAETELRKTVQLALLTAKLERGESWDKDELLAQWLSHGSVAEDEKALIPRVNRCLDVLIEGRQEPE